MTKRELIAAYNEVAMTIGWNPVKQFRDVATGERRLALARKEQEQQINIEMEKLKHEKEEEGKKRVVTACSYCGFKMEILASLNTQPIVCIRCEDNTAMFNKYRDEIRKILDNGRIAVVQTNWENEVPDIFSGLIVSNYNSLQNVLKLWFIERQDRNRVKSMVVSCLTGDELPDIYYSSKHKIWKEWNRGKGITNPRKLRRVAKEISTKTIKRWLSLWSKGKNLPAITRMGIKIRRIK